MDPSFEVRRGETITFRHGDRILVLERGRLVEQGPHEDLLERNGLCYAMWRQQVGERRDTEAIPA